MFLKKLSLVVISTILSLVLVESGFRLLIYLNVIEYPNPDLETAIHQYSEIEELVYELKPSFSSQDGIVITNKFGMRDYEYDLTKPENITRIGIIGDSVAFGYRKTPSMLPLEHTFPKLLEAKLNAAFPHQYEVLNFAVTGYNAFQEEIVLKTKVLQFEPDIVIGAYVYNDDTYTDGLGDLTKAMSPHSLGTRLHSKLVSYLLHQYEIENSGNREDMGQIWSLFEQLKMLSNDKNFEVIILISAKKTAFGKVDKKHELVKEKAISHGFMVIDLKEHWQDLSPEIRDSFYTDKTHYSVTGMQQVADILFEYIK